MLLLVNVCVCDIAQTNVYIHMHLHICTLTCTHAQHTHTHTVLSRKILLEGGVTSSNVVDKLTYYSSKHCVAKGPRCTVV